MDEWLKIIVPLAAIIGSLAVAIVVWFLNEWSKREWEIHKRKEDRYTALIESVPGFMGEFESTELRKRFLQELQIAWLYCPDSIINSGNAFLDALPEGREFSKREEALYEFHLALRKDLIKKTQLSSKDSRLNTSLKLSSKE